MATTYPLSTLGPTITSAGISIPTFNDVLQSLIATFQAIYGSDAYLQPDSQDGQLLSAFAKAINDSNMAAVSTFNSFSPSFAQGAALSSNVKLNGLQRLVPTFSTVAVTLTGVVGAVITNGAVSDGTNTYLLPASATIGGGGTVTVTATCSVAGAVKSNAGTVTHILTPQIGWQSVTNAAASLPGNPVEPDAALRIRQSQSTAQPATSVLAGIESSLANLTGVTQIAAYENTGSTPDANGAPAHSVYFVVLGGAAQDIVNAIGGKKTLGAATYGTSNGVYVDPITQVPYTINYFVPTPEVVAVHITVHALTAAGVNAKVTAEIQSALQTYLNTLGIGVPVQTNRLYAPAYLNGAADGLLYEVTVLEINLNGGGFSTSDIAIAYNQIASAGAVTITVT